MKRLAEGVWRLKQFPMLAEPPEIFTYDPAENRRSIRKLADLEPALILPGHGPAVTDIAKFERFVGTLSA